jgi:LysM repeat protein
MNSQQTPTPDSSLQAQKSQGRARVKVAFFSVVAVHVAGLMALLMTQGCKREKPVDQTPPPEPNPAPMVETTNPPPPIDNPIAGGQTGMITNPPVPPIAPPIAPPSVPPATAATTEYIVKSGDSFATIAKAHGTTWQAIQAANPNVDPKKLQINQKLMLPPPSATAPKTATATAPTNGENIYTVKSGDTLIQLAKHYGTTTKAIKSLNGLTGDQIKVGQKLKIPTKAAPTTTPTTTEPTTAPMVPDTTAPQPPPVTPPAH